MAPASLAISRVSLVTRGTSAKGSATSASWVSRASEIGVASLSLPGSIEETGKRHSGRPTARYGLEPSGWVTERVRVPYPVVMGADGPTTRPPNGPIA